jgi:hypothetical protein
MTTLVLKYTTSIEDLLAFTEYYQRNSVSFRRNLRKQQFLYLGGSLIGGLLFAYLALQDKSDPEGSVLTGILALLLCASPGILIFALLPRMTYKSACSQIRKAFEDGKNTTIFGEQELTINDDALTIRGNFHELRMMWEAIEKMCTTPNHIFLYTSAASGIVIPKQSVLDGDWRTAERILQEKIIILEEEATLTDL